MKNQILHILLFVLLLCSLCACGPDKTGTVKIVASLSLDPMGIGADWEMAQGMQLALEEADYRAGDFRVEYELWDDSGPDDDILQTELEEANAEKAAADSDVLIYLGPSTSRGCMTSVAILNRAGLVQISPSATHPGLTKPGFGAGEPGIYYPTGERTFFRLAATDDMQGPAAALWAQDLGLTRVYIVEQDDVYGQGLAHTFSQQAEAAGLTIVGSSIVAEGQTSGLKELAVDIAARQSDLVYFTGFDAGGAALVQALRTEGVTARFMGGDGIYVDAFIDELGEQAEGTLATFPSFSVADLGEAGQDFSRRFEEQFGHEATGYSPLGYEMMRIALAAIEKAGVPERAAVLDALRGIEFEGLTGRWAFDENGDTRLLLITGMHVQDGEWQSGGLLRVR